MRFDPISASVFSIQYKEMGCSVQAPQNIYILGPRLSRLLYGNYRPSRRPSTAAQPARVPGYLHSEII